MWTPLTFPEPCEGFVAHSVVVAHGGCGPWVAWPQGRPYAAPADGLPEPLRPGTIPPELHDEVASLLRRGARADQCGPLVCFNGGTLVATQGAEPFGGFAGDGADYAIPCHRFRGGVAEQAAIACDELATAQAIWDRDATAMTAEERAAGLTAFATLQRIGYALPGCDCSDGDVVAAWRRDAAAGGFEVFALARLRMFPANVAVAVLARMPLEPFRGLEASAALLGGLADLARTEYRTDCLRPMVAQICPVAGRPPA